MLRVKFSSTSPTFAHLCTSCEAVCHSFQQVAKTFGHASAAFIHDSAAFVTSVKIEMHPTNQVLALCLAICFQGRAGASRRNSVAIKNNNNSNKKSSHFYNNICEVLKNIMMVFFMFNKGTCYVI